MSIDDSHTDLNLAANDVVIGWTTLTVDQNAPFQSYVLLQMGNFEVYSDDSHLATSRKVQIPLSECHVTTSSAPPPSPTSPTEQGHAFLSFFAKGDQWTVVCSTADILVFHFFIFIFYFF